MAASAKGLRVAPISSADARIAVVRWHYSRSFARNSQLHLGVFWEGRLEGVMQFGPSMDKGRMVSLVRETRSKGFLELNRMAFSEGLPRNSESRAISVAMRMSAGHIRMSNGLCHFLMRPSVETEQYTAHQGLF
jgi:hypothetical protein